MNTENEIITGILSNFNKSPHHKNDFFQSDSEIITLGNRDYLISVDSYSDEDHFRLNDPYNLGMNLAACTLSDIFACGGKPLFFCNSFNCENSWNKEYIDSISKGISFILDKCGTGFIGGDFGFCSNWNFTGVVIGESERIVTRKGALDGDLIYLTGKIGAGNFEAASVLVNNNTQSDELFRKFPVLFPLRIQEAGFVSKYATSAIDTSDGLFKSLSIIAEINKCGFEIGDLPYYTPGMEWTKNIGLPKECLMFGECGEYELLFTVKPDDESELLKNICQAGCNLYKIGKITKDPRWILNTGNLELCINDFNLSARNFKDHHHYINYLTQYLLGKGIK